MAQKIRNNPRISINQLAEYLIATAARRRSILIQQKFPPSYIAARYDEAQDAVADYVTTFGFDSSKIIGVITQLSTAVPKTATEIQKLASCIEVLEIFLENSEILDFLSKYKVTSGVGKDNKMKISGVEVSLRPEIIFEGKNEKGKNIVGAVKLFFSKNIELTEKEADYITTSIKNYVQKINTDKVDVPNNTILVYDVFRNKLFLLQNLSKKD